MDTFDSLFVDVTEDMDSRARTDLSPTGVKRSDLYSTEAKRRPGPATGASDATIARGKLISRTVITMIIYR